MMDTPNASPVATMADITKRHLLETLILLRWNKTHTAVALDLDRRTVIRMIARFGLKRPSTEPGDNP